MSLQQSPAIPFDSRPPAASTADSLRLLDAPIDPHYLRSSRLALVWDRRRLLFDASLWGAALALLAALLSPSRFTSTARLMPPDPPLMEQLTLLRSLSELAGFSLDSSKIGGSSTFIIPANVFATILSSNSIQNGVIDKLGLRKVYGSGTQADTRRELSRRTNISVDRKTHFLTIEVTDHDPQRAQQITAEYIAELSSLLARVDNSASHRERVFLQQRLLEVGHDLQGAESDFSRFSAGNFLVDLHDEDSTLQQTVLYLQDRLIAEKTQLQALRTVYADDNVHVHEAHARILELTRQIRQLGGHSNPTLMDSASTLPLIPLRKLPALGVGYVDLLRRVKVDEALFEVLARKYEIAKAQEAREHPSVTVLDSPELPEKRVFPLRVLMIAAGACLALLSCAAWIFLKSDWDRLAPEDSAKLPAAGVYPPKAPPFMRALSLSTILAPHDVSAAVRRYIFPGFLIFSVCFYSYRFLVGMGSSLTTYYDSDAPTWLRILKDGVWVAVLLIGLVFSNAESWEFTRRNRQEHAAFFRALFALVVLFLIMAVIHLFYFQSAMDTFLYWIRYPLEYIPLAFFLPLFVLRWRPLAPLLLGLGWLSIAFLAFEMFSGKQMGFFNRYGSILGSPNDYGMFCGLFIIGLLVCARRWTEWLLLAFMICGLFLTLSRSALVGTVAAICSLLYLRRARIGVLVAIVLFGSLIAILFWRFPDIFGFQQVQYALAHFDVDSSALSRLNELQIFQTRFGNFDLATLLFGTDYFHIESWYLALLVRTGFFGLLLWLAVMAATLVRGWGYRHVSRANAVAFASVIGICVASAFIPYPDTFPTNLYLWLAVGTVWMPAFRESSPRPVA